MSQPLEREMVDFSTRAMGGHLGLRIIFNRPLDDLEHEHAAALLLLLSTRIHAWSNQITRRAPSELTALNAEAAPTVAIGPTLSAVLAHAKEMEAATAGRVDVTLLNARLAAEHGHIGNTRLDRRPYTLTLRSRTIAGHEILTGGLIARDVGTLLDLDGVGKGWIADRAASLMVAALDRAAGRRELPPFTSCYVDADGDLALRHRPGGVTRVRIEFTGELPVTIGEIELRRPSCGIATSGTGVHRWADGHHLIDPATGRSSTSPIIQATVVAASAREAEAHAKAMVIGGGLAIEQAARAGIDRAVLISHEGTILLYPAVGEPSDIPFLPAA